ncbi:immunity protein Imm33 domain-containing protein [Paractinoplanes deccanensis]|uniref:immunity protein Imm33 domain-containing protein n=1 Tax=Paractinoplanes deccanensis TaxID=113561 RepID=UPI003F6940F6
MCRRFGVRPMVPARGSMVGIALSRGPKLVPLNTVRHLPVGSTNGWYVWRGDQRPDDADFFSASHVEHMPEQVPELLPYLALPPGWGVVLAPGYEDVFFDEAFVVE